jgi:hypothetical protein
MQGERSFTSPRLRRTQAARSTGLSSSLADEGNRGGTPEIRGPFAHELVLFNPPRHHLVQSLTSARSEWVRTAGGLGNCGRCITPKSCNGQTGAGWWRATTARASVDPPDPSASAIPSTPSRPRSASGRATSSGASLRCDGVPENLSAMRPSEAPHDTQVTSPRTQIYNLSFSLGPRTRRG